MNKKTMILIFVLAGSIVTTGCSKAIAPTAPEMEDLEPIQELEETETGADTIEVSSQREQISGADSARSGYREGPVMVKSYVELDPRAFAGTEDNEEKRADCNAKILKGTTTQEECPTNTILRLSRIDEANFPKEINRSEFNDIKNNIENLTIGCVADGNYSAAPIRNFRDELTTIVSPDDQEGLMTAADQDITLNIRISKYAYDIQGRGGSPCDIFFNKLSIEE